MFAPKRTIVSISALDIAAGPIDGNLSPDFAFSRSTDVTPVLNDGNAAFLPGTAAFAGGAPVDLALADFNGDLRHDAVTANFTSGSISVLLAAGDGAFGFADAYNTCVEPRSVAVGRIDGDKTLDIAVACAGAIRTWFGDGDGGFIAGPMHMIATAFPAAVAVGDLDGDGDADIAYTIPTTNQLVRLRSDPGTLTAQSPLAVDTNPGKLAIGDLDRDTRADIVVVSRDENTFTVYLACVP
jgi:hypothetical protein